MHIIIIVSILDWNETSVFVKSIKELMESMMRAVLGFEFFDRTDFKESEFLEIHIRNGI